VPARAHGRARAANTVRREVRRRHDAAGHLDIAHMRGDDARRTHVEHFLYE
jgi:hypothetical protein